jgi:hypothetical protein
VFFKGPDTDSCELKLDMTDLGNALNLMKMI